MYITRYVYRYDIGLLLLKYNILVSLITTVEK